jgi:thioredoxin reductase
MGPSLPGEFFGISDSGVMVRAIGGTMTYEDIDVAVVGSGPAGTSACIELAKSPGLKIALFETNSELGGMPRSCHIFFGMRDRKRLYTGPHYAQELSGLVRRTSTAIYTKAHVFNIGAEIHGNHHRIDVLVENGLKSFSTQYVILAMGCSEMSAGARQLPSRRPAGIYTTGTLQQMVNIYRLKPGEKALLIGSEHIALSSLLTLRRAGVSIAGIVEEDSNAQTYQLPAKGMSLYFGFPIYKGTWVKNVLGAERVEAVDLVRKEDEKAFQVQCDTVIITGKFRPDSHLIDGTPIERDPSSQGPLVDMNLMTSVPNIFAAGNVLRGADMHDLCALEGKVAARSILNRMKAFESPLHEDNPIGIRVELPIRYVVPQTIMRAQVKSHLFPWLYPGYSIQLERTIRNPVIEARSGNKIIWKRSYSKLIANTRILIPVTKFDWDQVDEDIGIVLGIQDTNS